MLFRKLLTFRKAIFARRERRCEAWHEKSFLLDLIDLWVLKVKQQFLSVHKVPWNNKHFSYWDILNVHTFQRALFSKIYTSKNMI